MGGLLAIFESHIQEVASNGQKFRDRPFDGWAWKRSTSASISVPECSPVISRVEEKYWFKNNGGFNRAAIYNGGHTISYLIQCKLN
jgi:hypothetical protein